MLLLPNAKSSVLRIGSIEFTSSYSNPLALWQVQHRLFILILISTFSITELCKTHWRYIQAAGRFDLVALGTARLNSKWIWFGTQVRRPFSFCSVAVQIFTDFIAWRRTKAYKEGSIQVKAFVISGEDFSLSERIKKLYLKQRKTELQYFWKLVIWQHWKVWSSSMKPNM